MMTQSLVLQIVNNYIHQHRKVLGAIADRYSDDMAERVDDKATRNELCRIEGVDALIYIESNIKSVAIICYEFFECLFALAARDSQQLEILLGELIHYAIEQAQLNFAVSASRVEEHK